MSSKAPSQMAAAAGGGSLRPDVAIVGAGPAGLMAALALRRRGLTTRVLERRSMPSELGLDKPCGEGLMPSCVTALTELGVDLEGAGMPFRGIRYTDRTSSVRADFPGGPGLGVRRTTLSKRLLEAALEAGVQISWGSPVNCSRREDRLILETSDARVEARFVVGADGLRSKVRDSLGLAASPAAARRFGVRRHYRVSPWSDAVEVSWCRGVEAYVTPVAVDTVGVAVLWNEKSVRERPLFDSLLARFPRLEQRLRGAPCTAPVGCGPLRQGVRGVTRGNAALIGDASGYVDAITGEGLSLAAAQAPLLAAAIDAARLGRYASSQARVRRLPEWLTEATLLLSRYPSLRRRTLRAFQADPGTFQGFLAVLAGGEARVSMLARPSLRLLAGLVAS